MILPFFMSRRAAGAPGPDPTPAPVTSLFANNEPGVWMDFSSIPWGLFQSGAGWLFSQEPDDPAGLWLDRSRGLAPTPQIMSDIGNPYTSIPGEVTQQGGSNGAYGFALNSGGIRLSVTTVATVAGQNAFIRVRLTGADIVQGELYAAVFRTRSNVDLVVQAEGGQIGLSETFPVADEFDQDVVVRVRAGEAEQVDFRLFPRTTAATSARLGDYVELRRASVVGIAGSHAIGFGSTRPLLQADSGMNPYLQNTGGSSLPARIPDLGSNATIARANENGVEILSGQTLGPGSLQVLGGIRTYGIIANNRPWTAAEVAGVQAHFAHLKQPD